MKIKGLEETAVGDYWSWAYSDILCNTNRSIFAEFLVAHALSADSSPRIEWDAYDCLYKGKGIEVKSAAYVQSWAQSKPSVIQFDIANKLSWYSETNTYSKEPLRPAFCYIFCLHTEKERLKADPLDLAQWVFYLLPTETLNRNFPFQKTIRLTVLHKMCKPIAYESLKEETDKLFD